METSAVSLAQEYSQIRQVTEALVRPLQTEDYVVQSMPDASPTKWHLAHTTWFFETFVLGPFIPGYQAFHPTFAELFNSYYHAVGPMHPRPQRGTLTRPTVAEVVAYRRHVDEHMGRLLDDPPLSMRTALEERTILGLQHEQQHQELILTDLKHLWSLNPLHPVYRLSRVDPSSPPGNLRWHFHPGGPAWAGFDGEGFSFDNERPRHRVVLRPFALGDRLITNGDYLAFMREGGYEQPLLWLSDGWTQVQEQRWNAPLYWEKRDDQWVHFTLGGLLPVDAHDPVCHVSYYEADAFARWMGARLPTEFEWEAVATAVAVATPTTAATAAPATGTFLESGRFRPRSLGRTASVSPRQLLGDVWEWTGSPYVPYPGYRPLEGLIAEYNGKFMCNQLVLRGGSCATPQSHIRTTYRNFFPPAARWQFSGIRLAKDA